MLELLLGQIPEAIFFALFMIYAKNLKEKRILFIILMIAEYLLLKSFIKYNIWFQISYTFITYLLLKLLYKDKAQIIDIFTFTIGSFALAVCSIISVIIGKIIFGSILLANIICKIVMFSLLFILNNKLYSITKFYKKSWNRNDKIPKKIKTTTFRAVNIVVFNFIFAFLNLCMLYAIYYNNFMKGGM
mgnify:CR=1 FL=1